ncbi:DUF262 domain-containing protein [Stagnihabitans tardus]|uniref:DUF262 domain-containing protein n=1 Tax=Stagnihabitans tardus TaxID=2699202 RepID=A0AAE4YBB6_9RHOB|nr:DUF262 domain-containing protein [Stagnihabitans tardus]NBZ89443.1 DUF262 domain-containing protein [Stagnihabitans tardus]
MPHIDTGAAYIGSILRDGKPYLVPKYQRDYSWTKDEVEQLWEDITRALKDQQSTYFIGSIVINDGNSSAYEVIDGQQRLTTLSILLCALRDRAKMSSNPKLAERLESDFLGKFDYGTQETSPKITLNINNRAFFSEKIINADGVDSVRREAQSRATSKSNRLLAESYLYFHGVIERELADGVGFSDFVQRIVEALDDVVQVIRISVKDDYDAYMLFETLNDRGLALSVADLLKNYLFSKADDRIDEVQANWALMSQRLDRIELKRFLRHSWLSRHNIVRDKELFQRVKEKYNTKNGVVSFSKELRDTAEGYAALGDPQSDFWADFFEEPERTKIRGYIEELKLFGVNQYNPLLVSTLETAPSKFLSVLRMVVAFAFRYSIILGAGTGNIEKSFTAAAVHLRNNQGASLSDIFSKFSSLYPSDADFSAAFARKSVEQSAMARHILTKINDRLEEDSGLVVNRDASVVNLEHVLPQKFDVADWTDFGTDADALSEYVTRIGNMTLLKSSLNRRISNKGFSEKLPHYKQSSALKISEEIFDCEAWTAKSVETRQQRLAKIACQIWRVDL